VSQGDDIAQLVLNSRPATSLVAGDIVVVAQKIVSKAEGAVVDLRTVEPSVFAKRVAATTGKDPRVVEVVLQQSSRIVRMSGGVLITQTHHGFVCANAGVDASNIQGDHNVATLPVDPDASASRIRKALARTVGDDIAVIISDTFNRPWRVGSMNVAIGVAGMAPLGDQRGQQDDFGQILKSTLVSLADETASAAQLVIGESGRIPAAVVRNMQWKISKENATSLVRPADSDLFR
jgi:coenzyme F420-0:L-glutamate ligase/coenzyme F420-1:gamma-L-glutamate ligase